MPNKENTLSYRKLKKGTSIIARLCQLNLLKWVIIYIYLTSCVMVIQLVTSISSIQYSEFKENIIKIFWRLYLMLLNCLNSIFGKNLPTLLSVVILKLNPARSSFKW